MRRVAARKFLIFTPNLVLREYAAVPTHRPGNWLFSAATRNVVSWKQDAPRSGAKIYDFLTRRLVLREYET